MNDVGTMNHLRGETSPYLLQHASNPVDWYPWGEEAFRRAREEDRPIFLSIGYSTCHWCHVMAHESFEDSEMARLMNDTFVCIKVDREERPDIDGVYMKACQKMTGGGGWPLTIIMTPDKKPFFAGTYIPKENRFGMLGMRELISRVKEIWESRRNEALATADKVASTLDPERHDVAAQTPDEGFMESARTVLEALFDEVHGGFGGAPKFPMPHNLFFLLRYFERTHDPTALAMVEETLEAMARGGIRDHVGGGFHRYSVDVGWRTPHFEKMLYDQALLAMAYTEAFQVTGKPKYRHVAEDTYAYVLHNLRSEDGVFYSSEDADSEGEEGAFYLWTAEEIRECLTSEEWDTFARTFDMAEGDRTTLALRTGMPDELDEAFIVIRKKLREKRDGRPRPARDDKILCDWNGLMIASLACAGRVFGNPEYIDAARRAARFLSSCIDRGERLVHTRKGGASIDAFLDDYAFLAWGFLELYEATFEPSHLTRALKLCDTMIDLFWDDKEGGFYFTPHDGERLLMREKELYDGAIPSGNSCAALVLLRLSHMTGKYGYEERADMLLRVFSPHVLQAPHSHTMFLVALDISLGPVSEVVIVGDTSSPETRTMMDALKNRFLPRMVRLFFDPRSPALAQIAPFVKDMEMKGSVPTAYVCTNHACALPTTSVDEMLEMLGESK